MPSSTAGAPGKACLIWRRAVELHGFMLANYAEVNRGLLYVQGGGWEFATVSEVPAVLHSFIAGHVLLPPDSTLDSTVLEVALETPSGKQVPLASVFAVLERTGPVDGEIRVQPVASHMPLPISEGGRHAVLVAAGGASVRIPVFVRVPPNT
jgi:hypothetical protein